LNKKLYVSKEGQTIREKQLFPVRTISEKQKIT